MSRRPALRSEVSWAFARPRCHCVKYRIQWWHNEVNWGPRRQGETELDPNVSRPAMDAEPAATGEPPPSSSDTASLPAGKGLGDKATRDMPPR